MPLGRTEHSTVTLTVVDAAPGSSFNHNNGEVPAELKAHFFAKYSTSGKKGGSIQKIYSAPIAGDTYRAALLITASSASAGTTSHSRWPTPMHLPQPHRSSRMLKAMQSHRFTRLRPDWSPLKVLVVDDDDFNLMVIDLFATATAAGKYRRHGRLALQAVAQARPDIIILDVEMPIAVDWRP
ncbi:MAG: hypothetical protein IPN06_08690 [Burkholderiales bacterium]|nr:hypothetical protein [Burkholderiales bacterium]